MNQDAKDNLQCVGWIAAFIAVLVCMVIILCSGCTIVIPLGGNTEIHQHSYIVSSRNTDTSGSTNAVSPKIDGGGQATPNVGINGDKAIEETAGVAKGFLVTPVAGEVLQGGAEALLKAKQIDVMRK